MLNAIKQAAVEAVAASNPVHVMFGRVIKTNPLEVNVDQRFTLTADFLVLAESITPLSVTVDGVEYVIRQGLQAGDKVLLLRMQGGQQYVVFDKVMQT